MSLTGMHIVFSSAAALNGQGPLPVNGFFGKTMSAGGTVSQIPASMSGLVLIRAHTTIQGYIATSTVSLADAATKAADPNSVRWIVEADSQDHDIYANPGDYVAWAAA